jgi:hypothetical protein
MLNSTKFGRTKTRSQGFSLGFKQCYVRHGRHNGVLLSIFGDFSGSENTTCLVAMGKAHRSCPGGVATRYLPGFKSMTWHHKIPNCLLENAVVFAF